MKDRKIEISVIVPVFNVEPYLKKCIDSIIGQTYKNLEIILVDDGSTDGSGQICDDYATKDERIVVFHQDNVGLSETRNKGIEIAKGEYLLFVDSDDWIEKESCELLMSIVKEQHADVVCFGFHEVSLSGYIKTYTSDSVGRIDKSEMIRRLIWNNIENTVWSKFYSRKIFIGIKFPKGRIYEDIPIMCKIINNADIIYGTNNVLYNYMHRVNSLSDKRYSKKNIKDRLANFNERLVFLEQNYPEYVDKQLSQIMEEMLIGKEWLKGDPDYLLFKEEFNVFLNKYNLKFCELAKYSRRIMLYCFCPFLANLYEKVRHITKWWV